MKVHLGAALSLSLSLALSLSLSLSVYVNIPVYIYVHIDGVHTFSGRSCFTVDIRKMEHHYPLAPNLKQKGNQHTSSYIYVPILWSLPESSSFFSGNQGSRLLWMEGRSGRAAGAQQPGLAALGLGMEGFL